MTKLNFHPNQICSNKSFLSAFIYFLSCRETWNLKYSIHRHDRGDLHLLFFHYGLPGSLFSKEQTTTEKTWSAPGLMEVESEKVQSNHGNQSCKLWSLGWEPNIYKLSILYCFTWVVLAWSPGPQSKQQLEGTRSPPAVYSLSSFRQKVFSFHLTAALSANQSTQRRAGRATSKVCSGLEC